LNPDINSDKCIGFGVPPATTHEGLRVTAASAFLSGKFHNLEILTDSKVDCILFDDKKAIGVELSNGKKCLHIPVWCSSVLLLLTLSHPDYSSKEIILCAGSIDTPKILLLSGIGPAQELRKHGISVVLDEPAIGSNLSDHCALRMLVPIKPGLIPVGDVDRIKHAREQWLRDRTGPLATDNAIACHGYLKLDIASYPEFNSLDIEKQELLLNPLTPAYELICVRPHLGTPEFLFYVLSDTDESYLANNPEYCSRRFHLVHEHDCNEHPICWAGFTSECQSPRLSGY
jgi:choline dehydrogenase-like flavoprotein